MTWEIRTAPTTVIGIGSGATAEPERVLRVEYRPAGSRGRFAAFTIAGKLPKGATIEQIVGRYNAERGPKAWRERGGR